jgi:hypothetical protein
MDVLVVIGHFILVSFRLATRDWPSHRRGTPATGCIGAEVRQTLKEYYSTGSKSIGDGRFTHTGRKTLIPLYNANGHQDGASGALAPRIFPALSSRFQPGLSVIVTCSQLRGRTSFQRYPVGGGETGKRALIVRASIWSGLHTSWSGTDARLLFRS